MPATTNTESSSTTIQSSSLHNNQLNDATESIQPTQSDISSSNNNIQGTTSSTQVNIRVDTPPTTPHINHNATTTLSNTSNQQQEQQQFVLPINITASSATNNTHLQTPGNIQHVSTPSSSHQLQQHNTTTTASSLDKKRWHSLLYDQYNQRSDNVDNSNNDKTRINPLQLINLIDKDNNTTDDNKKNNLQTTTDTVDEDVSNILQTFKKNDDNSSNSSTNNVDNSNVTADQALSTDNTPHSKQDDNNNTNQQQAQSESTATNNSVINDAIFAATKADSSNNNLNNFTSLISQPTVTNTSTTSNDAIALSNVCHCIKCIDCDALYTGSNARNSLQKHLRIRIHGNCETLNLSKQYCPHITQQYNIKYPSMYIKYIFSYNGITNIRKLSIVEQTLHQHKIDQYSVIFKKIYHDVLNEFVNSSDKNNNNTQHKQQTKNIDSNITHSQYTLLPQHNLINNNQYTSTPTSSNNSFLTHQHLQSTFNQPVQLIQANKPLSFTQTDLNNNTSTIQSNPLMTVAMQQQQQQQPGRYQVPPLPMLNIQSPTTSTTQSNVLQGNGNINNNTSTLVTTQPTNVDRKPPTPIKQESTELINIDSHDNDVNQDTIMTTLRHTDSIDTDATEDDTTDSIKQEQNNVKQEVQPQVSESNQQRTNNNTKSSAIDYSAEILLALMSESASSPNTNKQPTHNDSSNTNNNNNNTVIQQSSTTPVDKPSSINGDTPVAILGQLSDALQYTQDNSIVHNNNKPSRKHSYSGSISSSILSTPQSTYNQQPQLTSTTHQHKRRALVRPSECGCYRCQSCHVMYVGKNAANSLLAHTRKTDGVCPSRKLGDQYCYHMLYDNAVLKYPQMYIRWMQTKGQLMMVDYSMDIRQQYVNKLQQIENLYGNVPNEYNMPENYIHADKSNTTNHNKHTQPQQIHSPNTYTQHYCSHQQFNFTTPPPPTTTTTTTTNQSTTDQSNPTNYSVEYDASILNNMSHNANTDTFNHNNINNNTNQVKTTTNHNHVDSDDDDATQ